MQMLGMTGNIPQWKKLAGGYLGEADMRKAQLRNGRNRFRGEGKKVDRICKYG